jgi:LPXTG-motif cell wall-anchored protein
MKKLLLILAFFGILFFGGFNAMMAQEQTQEQTQEDDLFEMEDTLSIDDMDPVFYEAEEGSGSNSMTTVYIIGAVIVVGGGIYYFTKKKKAAAN